MPLVELGEARVEPRFLRAELELVRRERSRPVLELGHAPRDFLLELHLALLELASALVELRLARRALEPVVERASKLELTGACRVELGAELVDVRTFGRRRRGRRCGDGFARRPGSLELAVLHHRRARLELAAQTGAEAALGRLFGVRFGHCHLRS